MIVTPPAVILEHRPHGTTSQWTRLTGVLGATVTGSEMSRPRYTLDASVADPAAVELRARAGVDLRLTIGGNVYEFILNRRHAAEGDAAAGTQLTGVTADALTLTEPVRPDRVSPTTAPMTPGEYLTYLTGAQALYNAYSVSELTYRPASIPTGYAPDPGQSLVGVLDAISEMQGGEWYSPDVSTIRFQPRPQSVDAVAHVVDVAAGDVTGLDLVDSWEDWANGIETAYEYANSEGQTVQAFQHASVPAQSLYVFERVSRESVPPPVVGDTLAQLILDRTNRRGDTIPVTTRLRPEIHPGDVIELRRGGQTIARRVAGTVVHDLGTAATALTLRADHTPDVSVDSLGTRTIDALAKTIDQLGQYADETSLPITGARIYTLAQTIDQLGTLDQL